MTELHSRRPGTIRGWLFRSRSPLLRAVLIAALVALAALALIRIVAPFVISTGLVRDGIEDAIAKWTGHRVIIEDAPSLTFWPVPRVTLEDVTIEDNSASPPRRVARIGTLSASFDLLDALGGNYHFNDFRLSRPHVYLSRDRSGQFDWAAHGLLEEALARVKPGDGNTQVLDTAYSPAIGSIVIEDGTLEIADERHGRTVLSGLNADVTWPRLGDGLKLTARTRLRGQDAQIDLTSSQPLLLMAGRNANLAVRLQSTPLSARFDGTVNPRGSGYASGTTEIDIADLPALLSWARPGQPPNVTVKSITVTGNMLTSGGEIRLSNLNLAIDQTNASGAIELIRDGDKPPKLAGTLAFDRIDLRSTFRAVFATPSQDAPQNAFASRLFRALDLDLRLSAQSAAFGPLEAKHIGASILAAEGKVSFDIGDSEFEGGQLIAHLGTSSEGLGGDLDIAIRDADLGVAASKLAFTGPLPLGTGSLDADLRTDKPLRAMTANDVAGTVKLYVAPGVIPKVDVAALRSLAASKTFFRLSAASGEDFDFASAQITAMLENGSADIRSARIESRHGLLTLTGLVPYGTSGMALAGTLSPVDGDTATPALQFFAGGSWPDPVISPITILKADPQP